MKSFKILATVLFTGSFIFTGCSKPEEPDHFRYTVNDYPLLQGFIHNYGMPEGGTGYNFDVTIYSQGVSYNRELHEFQGQGHVVYFQMYSTSATELSAGTYQFSTSVSKSPSTFDIANFGININFSEETGLLINAVSGVVKVTGSAEYKAFDFECITTTGEKVTGHYNGFIPTYNMLDTSK